MILSMADVTSTTPLLPSSLRQVSSSYFGQCLRELSELYFLLILSEPNAHVRIHAIYMRRDHLIIHTFAAETIALFVLFIMWLVGTGISTVRPIFSSLLHVTLTQKRIVELGKLGVVPSVLAMPTPKCTRGNCMDRLGHFVLPSRC